MVDDGQKPASLLKDIVLPIITILLTVLSILYGTDIVDKYFGKVIVYNLSESELSFPPEFKVIPAHPNDVLPDRLVSFSFSNETSTNCIKPLFRIHAPGAIIKMDITDTTEKKEMVQKSVVYETVLANNDTARFESERLAPHSYINGHLWYKVAVGLPVSPNLSSENWFSLRRLGQENKTLTGPIATTVTAILAGFSAFLVTMAFAKR